MEKQYVRNPKGISKGKFEASNEDQEDFEQEKQIRDWLVSEGKSKSIDFQYISRKGTARNTFVKASVRLDQKIGEDGSGIFADIIAGCDGRDLFDRGEDIDPQIEATEKIRGYLFILGFNQGEIKWLLKTLLWSIPPSNLRFEKFLTDSEW